MSTGPAVAVIPARSGSTRLRGKNARRFLGHPLLAYSVRAALDSGCFAAVFVSTDSDDYAQVARHYGAGVIERPAELATERAGLVGVALHAIGEIRADGLEPETYCQLLPCCPLRTSRSILEHMTVFLDENRLFQLSLQPYISTYPQWAMKREANGLLNSSWSKKPLVGPSQDLEDLYCPSGGVWIARVRALEDQQAFYGTPLHGEVLSSPEGIDIDTDDDFRFAEALAYGYRELHGASVPQPIAQKAWQE